jgi:hypothetical protein
MKSWKRKLLVAFGIFICFGVFAYLTKDFWRQQLRIYTLGQIEVAAEHYQNLPQDIDTVEVFTLSDSRNPDDTNGFAGDFDPIRTLEHKTVTGTDAKEITALWCEFPVGRELQAMCFQPVYGLQFKRKGVIYFQTSVCWECSGYTLPISLFGTVHTVENGFESKSEGAQKLLETLERLLPLSPKPEPKKVQPQKTVAGITNS